MIQRVRWACYLLLAIAAWAQTPAPQPAPTGSTPAPQIPPLQTTITVTGKIATEAPASITTLDQEEIDSTPGVNLDDRLRQVPGFSMFRRSSSVVANPTTQGVSLRGLGSSGASRTLVLWDGVPINDPFGGWVYWTRVDPSDVDRVEISRGASTSVFGDLAMSGVIALFSRPPEPFHLDASYEGGSDNTQDVSASLSNVWRQFAATAEVRAFTTDGYFIVPQNLRGTVDTRANVRFVTGFTALDWFGGRQRLSVKLDILAEERDNGTQLTHNSTGLGTLSGNYLWDTGSNAISVLVFHTREDYHAGFSAVAASRNFERLTDLQTSPSEQVGAAAFWKHHAARWNLIAGTDMNRVEGFSIDHLLPSGIRDAGGTILQHGEFAQFDLREGPVQMFGGARQEFTVGNQTFFSPNGGLVVGKGKVRARGTVYRAFRAPTLNELYRQFRVGNATTLANPLLQPEKTFGAEGGVDFVGETRRFSVTAFRNSLDGLITNVTIAQNANSITRERENIGLALSRGIEASFMQEWNAFRFEAAYLYSDSRISATGLRIPEVPHNQGSADIAYHRGGTLISGGMRGYSSQFDDDLNQFLLPGFVTLQLAASQTITHGLSATLSLENILNKQYYVAFTPIPNIGAPLLWRAGLRWEGKVH